jgi:hypothetical protein
VRSGHQPRLAKHSERSKLLGASRDAVKTRFQLPLHEKRISFSAIEPKRFCGRGCRERFRRAQSQSRRAKGITLHPGENAAAFLSFDEQFHFLIAQSIDCVAAWNTIQDIKAQMDRVRYLSLPEVSL